VLKASFSELVDLCWKLDKQTIWYTIVRDLGLTQVPKDSITCFVTEQLLEDKSKVLQQISALRTTLDRKADKE
jgi:peptidyl-tRNA hydrolase